MGPFKHPVFDPLDLEIIDLVCEAAWAEIQAREPKRDTEEDGKLQEALRKRIFAVAPPGKIDFDSLYERVLTTELNRTNLPNSV